ncbi:MAG: B12-binding domain-containing radical SAM protein [Nanoarchaeota archaeon]|nr:B12-binding domain-containing radical SAM protein [Nanoarchaeota archaeon]MBU1005590.1 B12-binding domain-containing radical SAM protein [Nanoarchaeota archaeon]MBU1945976.1 B12-binding domain-containing radical SAM protein [Nanoarchaeota archaeon]
MANKIRKILLVSPRYTLFKDDVRRCVAPIGLAYLAAFLEKDGYEVKILDAAAEGYDNVKIHGEFLTYGLDDEEIRKKIIEFNPDVVGVSCIFSTQYENVKKVLKLVDDIDPNITTMVGGSHPTYAVDEVLDLGNVDYIVMGEAELSTLQLLNTLNTGGDVSEIGGLAYRKDGKNISNNRLQYIQNVDDLPSPARHLLNMELYFKINLPQNPYTCGKRVAQVITSRGCPARCVFCTTTNFWGNRYRGRSAEGVVKEIRELKEKYNIDEIQFTDDNLTLEKKRAMDILDGIKNLGLMWCLPQGIAVWALDEELLEKMKESGCYQLTFAIESGNQHVLTDIIKKPLNLEKVKPLVKKAHELGINLHAFCICGLPGETVEQMYETYNFVLDCGFESASFFLATPLIGSELLKICREKGYLSEDMTCNKQLFKIGNITTPEFKAEEIQSLVEQFNRDYNRNDKREKRFEDGKY